MPTLLAYYIHQLSPFIVQFSERFGLHWYGFAYVMAFLLGYWAYRYLAQRGYGEMPPEKVADFITFASIFGVMLGGRVGWILFYGWDVVRAHPLNAFKLWEGGMASHGGILGLVIFTYVYARLHRYSWPGVGDNLVVVAPIGLFLVRMANFVNGELWGRITPQANPPAWAMWFPKSYDGSQPDLVVKAYADDPQALFVLNHDGVQSFLIARAYEHDPKALDVVTHVVKLRHPSQIYEALLEGAVLFTVLWIVRTRLRAPVGMLTGIFMVGYAVLRIIGEQLREPDASLTWGLTRGQFLSLFMIVIGAAFIVYAQRTRHYQLPGMRRPEVPASEAEPVHPDSSPA